MIKKMVILCKWLKPLFDQFQTRGEKGLEARKGMRGKRELEGRKEGMRESEREREMKGAKEGR
jgi:hypothetical protein